jgi:CubicO group peptidase (beta-lactamase class C family)
VAAIANHLVQKLNHDTKSQKLGSAALLLVQGDRIMASHSFGIANVETRSPVKVDRTLYQMASVSKLVTAWGVMKLVQDGKIGLDEPVLRYLKRWQFPVTNKYRDKVTIRHLLSHTGGLEDAFGYAGFFPGDTIQTLEESLTLTKDPVMGEPRGVTVVKEPGKDWYYSGGGYAVLQLLIEEVTNQSFADYMEAAVLQPLGMTEATFDAEKLRLKGRTEDLATSFDEQLKPSPQRRYTATAAASLYATPQDMARFVQAYTRNNPVLSPETLKQMMIPQPGTHEIWGLGHGIYVPNDAGGYVVGHDGGNLPALGCTVRVNPATGNAIVLMVSGSLALAPQLGDDWVYWETGKLTLNARLGILVDRLVPALVTIGCGAIAIVLWRLLT